MLAPILLLAAAAFLTVLAIDFRKPNLRITNGQPAGLKQFPFQALIVYKMARSERVCGGSILTEYYILSSADCHIGAQSVNIYVGKLNFKEGNFIKVPLNYITDHPDFNKETLDNNICLIEVWGLTFSESVNAVRLPCSSYSTYEGESVIAAGWGEYSDVNRKTSYHLLYTELTVMDNDKCQKTYGALIKTNMCTVNRNGKSTAYGDFGGALILKSSDPKNPTQIGIISHTAVKGPHKFPAGVHVRVNKYLPWLEKFAMPTYCNSVL